MTNHQTNPTTEPPLLFAIHEAADLLGIGRTNVYVLMNNGKLDSVRIGGRRLIPRVSLERFVDELLKSS